MREIFVEGGISLGGGGDEMRASITWVGASGDQLEGFSAIYNSGQVAWALVELVAEIDSPHSVAGGEAKAEQKIQSGRINAAGFQGIGLDDVAHICGRPQQPPRRSQQFLGWSPLISLIHEVDDSCVDNGRLIN